MTQHKRIAEYLKTHNHITSRDASRHLGIERLSARIYEMEHYKGFVFDRERVQKRNRYGEKVDYIAYSLVKAGVLKDTRKS